MYIALMTAGGATLVLTNNVAARHPAKRGAINGIATTGEPPPSVAHLAR